jgi:glycosyltransferase involved in cell wall biosynthesis
MKNANLEDKKLLYFSSSWSGGIADYAHEQAKALGHQGLSVTLLTSPLFKKEQTQDYQLLPILASARAYHSPFALVRKLVLAWQIIQNHVILARVIRKYKFKFVLLETYSEYMAPLWSPFLRKLAKKGVKFGAVVHDPVRGYVVGPLWWHRWSIACGYSFLSEAFVHEPIKLDTVKNMPLLRTTVIPHGSYFFSQPSKIKESARQSLTIPLNAQVILSFGHIRDNKNLDLTLKAIAAFPNIYLVIAGKVASESQRSISFYQSMAQNLGVADRCRWLIDFIPESGVANLFNMSDLILLTYNREFQSASGVLNTAIAYRRPCIASSGEGNLKSVVQKYDLGIFIAPDSAEAIRDGLDRWLRGEMPSPHWEQYEQENSWERNAEIVIQKLLYI